MRLPLKCGGMLRIYLFSQKLLPLTLATSVIGELKGFLLDFKIVFVHPVEPCFGVEVVEICQTCGPVAGENCWEVLFHVLQNFSCIQILIGREFKYRKINQSIPDTFNMVGKWPAGTLI